jgi:hypothetical protein
MRKKRSKAMKFKVINLMFTTKIQNTLLAFILCQLWGCGLYVGNPTDGDDSETAPKIAVSGSVTLGFVGEALVYVYRLDSTATRSDLLGSTQTDNDGNYSLDIATEGPIEIVALNGHYEDEATGETVSRPDGDELVTILEKASATHTAIHALTTIAAYKTKANSSRGLVEAIAASNQDIANMFGVTDAEYMKTKPHDLTDSTTTVDENSTASKIGLIVAGFSQIAKDNNIPAEDQNKLIMAMAEDYSDGTLDGKFGDRPLVIQVPISPKMMMDGFGQAMNNFASSPQNRAGFSVDKVMKISQGGQAAESQSKGGSLSVIPQR